MKDKNFWNHKIVISVDTKKWDKMKHHSQVKRKEYYSGEKNQRINSNYFILYLKFYCCIFCVKILLSSHWELSSSNMTNIL